MGIHPLVCARLVVHICMPSIASRSSNWDKCHARWLFKDATPLFIASMYSHPALVRWLLVNGADRSTACYLKQTALDFVGECCEHASAVPEGSRANASAECRELLQEPPSLPFPPGERVVLSSTFSSEVVLLRSPAVTPIAGVRGNAKSVPGSPSGGPQRNATPSTASTLQQKIFKCLVNLAWETPLSNGAIIDRYEVRYRIIVSEDGDDFASPAGGGDSSSESWRLERTNHNRKSREQKILIAGLQFDTLYEFMLRSWNAAGKGEWGRSYKVKTRESPDLSTS